MYARSSANKETRVSLTARRSTKIGNALRERLTSLEKVDAGVVAADVEPVLHVPVRLEPQHGEIVAPVIAEEEDPAGLEHLFKTCGLVSHPKRDEREQMKRLLRTR